MVTKVTKEFDSIEVLAESESDAKAMAHRLAKEDENPFNLKKKFKWTLEEVNYSKDIMKELSEE